MTSEELAKIMAEAADDKKALNILIQDVSKRSDICDFQLICSGSNERQTQAICDAIEKMVKSQGGGRPNSIEGKQSGQWILLDYGSVLAHIFLDEVRPFYALESLWPDAKLLKVGQEA